MAVTTMSVSVSVCHLSRRLLLNGKSICRLYERFELVLSTKAFLLEALCLNVSSYISDHN
jgi:hypothetical protein